MVAYIIIPCNSIFTGFQEEPKTAELNSKKSINILGYVNKFKKLCCNTAERARIIELHGVVIRDMYNINISLFSTNERFFIKSIEK